MKRIVLCADDYGQAANISQAIINLLEMRRISATSCLVTSPHWHSHAQWLNKLSHNFDVGLHLNLTEGRPTSPAFRQVYGDDFAGLNFILRKSLCRKLDKDVIYAEFKAQLREFRQALDRLPSFIDGHQHIHHFPVIRDVVIEFYKLELKSTNAYVRLVKERLSYQDFFSNFKKILIHLLGSRQFERLLKTHHIPHNDAFAGIYNFAKAYQFKDFFVAFLRDVPAQSALLMCHPGLNSSESGTDAIAPARTQEYAYLSSNAFLEDCQRLGVEIKPFSDAFASIQK